MAIVGCFALTAWAMIWNHLGLLQGGPIPYGNDGHCDVWYYYGLVHGPGAGSYLNPDWRYVGRLMYFGPLYLLKLLMPDVAPNVLSYFTYLPGTLAALYVALRARFATTTAAICCLFIGVSSLLLNIASTTYVVMACLAYSAGMLACLLWAVRLRAQAGWRPAALFVSAGALWSFSMNANLISVEFNTLFFALALMGLGSRPFVLGALVRATLIAAGYCVVGAVLGTAAYTAFGAALGVKLGAPFKQMLDVLAGAVDWEAERWLEQTSAFGLIVLALLLAAATLGRAWRMGGAKAFDLSVIAGVVVSTCLLNLFTAFARDDLTLVFDFHYVTLLLSIALVFCAAFDGHLRALMPLGKLVALLAAPAFIIVANWFLSDYVTKMWFVEYTQKAIRWTNIILACGLLLHVVLARVARGRPALALPALAVAIGGSALTLQVASGDSMRNNIFYDLNESRALNDMDDRALAFLWEHVRDKPVVWMAKEDPRELTLPIFRGLVRCNFTPAFPDALPDAAGNQQEPVAVGRTLVVLDGLARDRQQINAVLAGQGFELNETVEKVFPVDADRKLKITVGKVEALRQPVGNREKAK